MALVRTIVEKKIESDTNSESSGNVDVLLFSVAAAPLNLWGSFQPEATSGQLAFPWLASTCFGLNRASHVQRSCSKRKKQIIYNIRALKICINIVFPLIQNITGHISICKAHAEIEARSQIFAYYFHDNFFEIQISHRSEHHSKHSINPIWK